MSAFRKLLRFLRPCWGRAVWAVLLAAILSVLSLLQPLVMKYFVGMVEKSNWAILPKIAAALISIPLCYAAIWFIDNQLLTWVGQRFIFNIRTALYSHLHRVSLTYHDNLGTGTAINRLMYDVSTIYSFVVSYLTTFVNQVLWFVVGIVMIFFLNWRLALVTVALLPLYYLNYRIFSPRLRRKYESIREKWDEISQRLQETIAGQKLVKAYGREEQESNYFDSRTQTVMGESIESGTLSASFHSIAQAIQGIISVIIYCLGCWYVIDGRMGYGDVLAFMMYLWRVTSPVLYVTQLAAVFQQVIVSAGRVNELFDAPVGGTETGEGREAPALKGEVEFRDVRFEYVKDEPVLKGINLHVKPGTSVALVGKTGCGKTTLTGLLLRFHDVTSGELLVDGLDVRQLKAESLRRQVGQVLQDPILFTGSFKENIAYAAPDADAEELIRTARAAEIHDLVMSKPLAYDTIIGERGIKLSLGEKQRVSIARALLKKPAILILDEATASLDPIAESLIQKAFERLLRGRTSFIIAHRLSTITSCDLIVVMDAGRIVETGTHAELLQREDGLYRHYFDEQFTAFSGS